ncbi:DUF998 domain-containing protein [Nocardioides sp.]|uniref:DUF998 domain-containing protein n=1 Tax=Nocardioides sp. TaxID=35761 RepID=UPI0027260C47|nr:DUF998 domain-containing protein [Nocardioides sp.]MDO9455359.1 DUF998 domain-containing protein [Nocardioides sp.]
MALWLVRPAYVAAEVVTAAATTGGYSFVDDTVSDLGATGCDAAYCSPRHALMNGSFVGFGILLALGALLLAPRIGRLSTVLLVVAGVSSVAVGLAPVDQDAGLHTLAATPLFVAQPIALLVLSRVLRSRALLAGGLLTAVGAIGFVLVDGGAGSGALERLALWPVLAALALVAVRVRGGKHTVPTVRERRVAPTVEE